MKWLNAPRLLLVSETVAALQMMGDVTANDSVVTIDVGGGTTDVGVSLRYGRSARKPEKRFTASARFAGNKLLEALAHSPAVQAFFSGPDADDEFSPDALKSLLKSELRRKAGGGLRSNQTAFLADMFFDGIYEYAFKLLHAFIRTNPDWLESFLADSEQRLRVALLGNGFRLYEAFQLHGSGETLEGHNRKLKTRLVNAGLLPQAVADKLTLKVEEAPKSGLIQIGGLNAATQPDKLFEARERMLLLPKGLAASAEFTEGWLGARKNAPAAVNSLSIELSRDALQSEFPLTYRYWRDGTKDRTADLQNVFQSSSVFAGLYMDVGSLYLTGTPLPQSRSYAWLMTQYAKEAK
jgi:hypothetical protein